MSSRKENLSEEAGGCPGWMMTFGDIMSLLLTFFVLLLGFSTFDDFQIDQALGSLKASLGVLLTREERALLKGRISTSTGPEEGIEEKGIEEAAQKIKTYFKGTGLYDSIEIEVLDEGIAIRILNPLLFDRGKAGLKPESLPVLKKVIDLVKNIPNDINVEGHADSLPINTVEFPSNWELSAARAISVIRYFMKEGNIPGKRLGVAGYGDSRPLFPNDTPAHRALNRRIEILIIENKLKG